MIAIAILAEDFMQQVGTTVDHQMLICKVAGRIHAAQHFDNTQALQSVMSVVNRPQDFLRAISCGVIPMFNCDILSQDPFQVAGVPGGDQLVSAADTQIQIARLKGFERHAQIFGFLVYTHQNHFLKIHADGAPAVCVSRS